MGEQREAAIRTLKDFFDAEERNLKVSVEGLTREGIYQLAEDLDNIYETALKSLSPNPQDPEIVVSTFFLLAHLKFKVTMGLHLRCHPFEAQSQTREAIEAAAYAYVVHTVPNAWRVWKNRKNDKKTFNDIFTKDARFPSTHPHLSRLRPRHDYLSATAVHMNLDTFAGRLKLPSAGDPHHQIRLEYFDTDARDFLRRYLYLLDTYLGVLRVFRECLASHLSAGPWDDSFDEFSHNFEAAKRQLRGPPRF